MATYFVETYRPAYPRKGVHVHATRAKDWSIDTTTPGCTAVFRVDNVQTGREAIAVCVEKLSGKNVCVRQVV